MTVASIPATAVERLKAVVGASGFLDDPADLAPYLTDWRGLADGSAALVLKPATTKQVAAIVAICAEAGIAVTPQGGNTGLCAGSVPMGGVVLSLARMNRILAIDLVGGTMTVEAGCILADLQRIAAEHDRLFPLSLAAEGSCQIGGNLSTNAGGTQVLRYGTARELVTGLEVVLPDGRVLSELGSLRKDNRGYDLKQLFLGAEGTLGIITAATVKLFPAIRDRAVGLAALTSLNAAPALLALAQRTLDGAISGFELIGRQGLDLVLKHVRGTSDPLETRADWMVLIDVGRPDAGDGCRNQIEAFLAEALDAGLVTDATIAASEAQAMRLWRLREEITEAIRLDGVSTKHDVSIAIAAIPDFIREAGAAVEAACPGVRPVVFGHVGDGNIHFNLARPEGRDGRAFLAVADALTGIVYDVVARFGGSFSAEHGIGLAKVGALERYRSPVALDVMRAIKAALDPQRLMNPGKVLADQPRAEASRSRA